VKEMSQAKIIYFGHDLHFLRERREYQVKQEAKYLQSSIEWLKRELDLSVKADISYFFSDAEKRELQKINPFAVIDVVPLYIYDRFKHRRERADERKDIMFVGGFSHTPNIDAMEWFVESIWPIIEDNLPDTTLYIIGSNPTKEILALAKENIVVTGFVDDAVLDNYYRSCKVVVAPLRYGAGIKGKVVDALYNGMPLVTTTIGAEGFEDAQSAMMIADQPEQFAEKVQILYQDEKLAEWYAEHAEKYCRKYFSETYAKEKMNLIFHKQEVKDG
jgi:glycosyltransferase involved in cell wall biosynthesis